MVAVVIGMELVGPKKRKIIGVITAVFFAFGQTLLGVLAYFIRDYRALQLAIAVLNVAFISYWWYVIPQTCTLILYFNSLKQAHSFFLNLLGLSLKVPVWFISRSIFLSVDCWWFIRLASISEAILRSWCDSSEGGKGKQEKPTRKVVGGSRWSWCYEQISEQW